MLHTITASKLFLFLYPLFSAIGYGALAAGIARVMQRDWVSAWVVWMWGLIMAAVAWTYTRIWAEARYIEECRHLMEMETRRTAPPVQAPQGFSPMYANDVQVFTYKPNDGTGWFLEASPAQWQAVYELTRGRAKPNIPFNIIDGTGKPFSHPQLSDFRERLVDAGLATATSDNQVVLNAAGRAMVERYGSPTPAGRGKK